MATVDQVIAKLRNEQIALGREGLLNPSGRDDFEFGKLCGTFQAYEMMLASIEDLLAEEAVAEKRREED